MRSFKTILALVAALAIGLVTAIACVPDSPTPPPAPASASAYAAGAAYTAQGGISVSGTASMSLTPDIAAIVLGVEALDDTVAGARSQAAEAMTAIADVLTEAGIADEDIQTQRLSIQPQYDWSDETRKLTGFAVVNIVNVTVRDIDSLGPIVDRAVEAGGDLTRIQHISFSVDDTSAHENQLIAEAVQNATARAGRLAELTGVSLGRPLSINFGGGVPYPVFDRSFNVAMTESTAFDTPISAGEVETSVTVNIIFAIE